MKLNKKIVCYVFVTILCAGIIGCIITGCIFPSRDVEPLGNGYEEVTYTLTSISEPSASRFALQYRKPNGGTILIWSSVPSGPDIKDNIAVFVGDKAYQRRTLSDPDPFNRRLFTVRAPELPLDITDEVLWQWSKKTGKDFAKALEIASVVTISEKEDHHLEIRFAFGYKPDSWPRLVSLDWNQILDIMREVKEKGIVRKDRVWGTSYIEKEFKPEVQK